MQIKTVLMDALAVERALKRISHEIIENNKGVKNIVMLGIAKGGVPVCDILAKNIFDKYTHIANGETLTENSSETIKISTATTANGIPLCYQSVRDMGILGEQVGYYFYDGVFTFCLSDASDVLRDTWDNNTVPTVQLGEDSDTAWEKNTEHGNKAVVAYIKPIVNQSALGTAIAAGKNIFVMAKPAEGKSFLMNLNTASTVETGNGENSCYTNGIAQDFADAKTLQSLIDGYASGEVAPPAELLSAYGSVEALNAALANGSLEVLNVGATGSTVSLQELREQYNIKITAAGDYYTLQGSVTPNYMRLLYRQYASSLTYYSVWCGADGYKASDFRYTLWGFIPINPTVRDDKNATVTFA
jgi:hypothetical protein